MKPADIVPGKSIGGLALGTPAGKLPPGPVVTANVGSVDGIMFHLAAGSIDDVWIEDLRKSTRLVRFKDQTLASDTPLDQLKRLFGPCEEVADVLGGTFFDCGAGVTIGCDGEGIGRFVQLRLKRR